MPFPIRCFTCGKVVARYEQKYFSMLEEGVKKGDALNSIGMTRICCRRMFLGYVNIADKLLLFSNSKDSTSPPKNETESEE